MAEGAEAVRRLGERFWLLAMIGGLIALMTSINSIESPYVYWYYLAPGAVAVIAALIWGLMPGASKGFMGFLAILVLIAGLWLVVGPLLSSFGSMEFKPFATAEIRAMAAADMANATSIGIKTATSNAVTLTGAGVGGLIVALGGILGLFGLRERA